MGAKGKKHKHVLSTIMAKSVAVVLLGFCFVVIAKPLVQYSSPDSKRDSQLFGMFRFSPGIRAVSEEDSEMLMMDPFGPDANSSSQFFLVEYNQPVSYTEANNYCIETVGGNGEIGHGSKLASIDKDETGGNTTSSQAGQIDELERLCNSVIEGLCWFGLKYNEEAGVWIWENGSKLTPSGSVQSDETVSLTDWVGDGSTPDPLQEDQPSGRCATLNGIENSKWQSADCDNQGSGETIQNFICENPFYFGANWTNGANLVPEDDGTDVVPEDDMP